MEGYINFKKPQNEMFKKLDGKIEKIVDAHSNLNKLYALNEFPSSGGPRTPLELPPQLPPPPPWVPPPSSKVSGGQQNNNIDAFNKKFQENLIEVLKQQIAAVAKTNKFKFTTPPKSKPNNNQQQQSQESRSLLLKSSPQTLFNTIRRETSLLLNSKRGLQQATPPLSTQPRTLGLSLLTQHQNEKISLNIRPLNQPKQPNHQHQQQNQHRNIQKIFHTIKVVVPPTEFNHTTKAHRDEKESENILQSSPKKSQPPPLTYQVIKNKIKLFQQNNLIYLGKSQRSPIGLGLKRKKSHKSLDDIINKLQLAKCSPSPTNLSVDLGTSVSYGNNSDNNDNSSLMIYPNSNSNSNDPKKKPSFQEQIINSSARLLQTSACLSSMSAPTPIPVFRSPLAAASAKVSYYHGTTYKMVNLKAKKSKRYDPCGLKLNNYLERERPQPMYEKITIEQFAKCLDLVRTNDASLRRRQEQLSQAELRTRLPLSNRPIRLKRLRGEKIHMPVSASYKATRKAGLQ